MTSPVDSAARWDKPSCAWLEGDHPETAFAEFAKRTDPFTEWFKRQVREIHSIDLSAPLPGPMPQPVISAHS